MIHFLGIVGFWTLRIIVTLIAFVCFGQMCKQLGQPLAPRILVERGGRRVRLGTLDNVLAGTGAVWGTCMWMGLAVVLWLV